MTLVWHQLRFDQKLFWRNPAAVFFTVLFPLIFLIGIDAVSGDRTISVRGSIEVTTYYVPAVITLAVISATLVSLAHSLTRDRESGVLKRLRGTPLPGWVYITGRLGTSIAISMVMAILVAAVGSLAFGVAIPDTTVPALILTLAIGAAAFACLGFALTTFIPNQEAAPAITQAVVLPLYFVSGVFVPESEIPEGVLQIADLFPVRPLFEAFLAGFDPATTGSGLEPGHLAVVVAWGLVGLLIAMRRFRWSPRDG